MRRHTTTLLLSFLVLAAACSKSNYAQVEPDDLYFTHKDRKEALRNHNASSAIIASTSTEVPTNAEDGYEYANQHVPVLTTPSSGTINSTTLGSPTIQQYAQESYTQEPYYDSSVNPDYIPSQEYETLDESYSQYYIPDYQYAQPQTNQTPQITNNYYGVNPYNSYSSFYDPYNFSPWVSSMGFISRGSMMSYGIWAGSYWDWNYAYAMNGFYSNGFYSNCYYSPYTYSYFGNPSYYNNYGNINYYGGGGTYNNDQGSGYANGTNIINGPRKSMNNVSYYANKDNTTIKSRREDYMPSSGGESGRVANSSGRSAASPAPERVEYMRRGSSSTYTVAGTQDRRTQTSSTTVQQNSNRTNNNRTVIVPTQSRRTYSNRNASYPTSTINNNANRSNTRQSTYRSQTSTTRYSTPARTRTSGSRYGTTPSRSSGSSSYSPSRSTSRPSYTPSRSSGSSGRSSYTPSRSSSGSSRSTGTRSSGSSSRSSSSSSSSSKRN